jgi:hypothetical protein
MAFDLVVGKSSKVKDSPVIVGSIDFQDLPAISRLLKRVDSFFLNRVSNLFEDQAFSTEEVDQALAHLLPLLTSPLQPDEQALLHKFISVLAYARDKQQSLYGVAD